MAVDFQALIEQQRSGIAIGKGEPWPEQGVAFRVRRGSFRIPKGLRDRDPDEYARLFASRMPPSDMGGTLVITTRPDGHNELVTWRVIRVVSA